VTACGRGSGNAEGQRGGSCGADGGRRVGVHSFPAPPLTDSTDRTLQHEETNLFSLHVIRLMCLLHGETATIRLWGLPSFLFNGYWWLLQRGVGLIMIAEIKNARSYISILQYIMASYLITSIN
jgi:hypothetical protein